MTAKEHVAQIIYDLEQAGGANEAPLSAWADQIEYEIRFAVRDANKRVNELQEKLARDHCSDCKCNCRDCV